MLNESLNQLLSIIEKNTGDDYTSKLMEFAFKLAKDNMVDSEFKEQLFTILERKVNSKSYTAFHKWDYSAEHYILFQMYKNGIGVEKNPKAALDYLIKTIKKRNFKAAKEIVFYYKDGNPELSIEPNKEEMINWCFKTAEYDCPINLYFLALQASGKKAPPFYDLGINKSLPLAIKCLKKLNEDIRVFEDISWYLENLFMDITKDFYENSDIPDDIKSLVTYDMENVLWEYTGYNILNRIDSPHLLNLLGTVYCEMKDYKNAVKAFQRAFSFDSLGGCINLSEMYSQGLGVEQDLKKAFELKKKVIYLLETGYASDWWDLSFDEERKLLELIESVAESYHHGIGVEQSIPNAAKYYNILKNSEWTLHIPEDFKEQIVQRATDALSTIYKSD